MLNDGANLYSRITAETSGPLAQELQAGTYRPLPARKVAIPKKEHGAYRQLDIPTTRDRTLQRCTLNVLSPLLEPSLEPEQYGYRQGRNTYGAITLVRDCLAAGYRQTVRCDLTDYFGRIPHDGLLAILSRHIDDQRILDLLTAWLPPKGLQQGAPVSPLLGNLYMAELIRRWREFEPRFKTRIVNYADDVVLLGKDCPADMLQRFADRAERMGLRINEWKTQTIAWPRDPVRFLGYRIDAELNIAPDERTVAALMHRIGRITAKNRGPKERVTEEMQNATQGWLQHYAGTDKKTQKQIMRHSKRKLTQWNKSAARKRRAARRPPVQGA